MSMKQTGSGQARKIAKPRLDAPVVLTPDEIALVAGGSSATGTTRGGGGATSGFVATIKVTSKPTQ